MRVNHSGEVCAQALYRGQSLTAKLPEVRREMEHAADEEIDHLAWCEERIHQLGSHTSALNPLWYSLSFGIGASAGLISDRSAWALWRPPKTRCANTWKTTCNNCRITTAKAARW